jgi:nucleotide-binding universal stress UspA family protein
MKIKPTSQKGKVLVELEAKDEMLLKPLPFALKRILVPIDFSVTATKALQYALSFATAFDAELLLLHVTQTWSMPVEYGYVPPDSAVSQQQVADSTRKALDELCAREIGTRRRYQAQVREGVPWLEIAAAAQENDADLIILSTHGWTGLKHALMGSVAERVVRHAPCPVLVVREREHDFVLSGGPKAKSATPKPK